VPDLVLLAGMGESTNFVGNALRERFRDVPCIIEAKPSRSGLLKRRVQKLGLTSVVGQVLFAALAQPLLRKKAAVRISEIKEQYKLNESPLLTNSHRVGSVNEQQTIDLIQGMAPKVVVVNGTRIISARVLSAINASFLNMHAGITPAFRGCHGGYWAIAAGRSDLAGTTIHFVDKGIDTGGILRQSIFPVSKEDCFVTYPYLHSAVGIPILLDAITEVLTGKDRKLRPSLCSDSSHLYHHPTLWGYLWRRWKRGAR
jgi:folate-dependent phosphoribosylglycinamide formyltransferase PurN